jgi:hypothetical protein
MPFFDGNSPVDTIEDGLAEISGGKKKKEKKEKDQLACGEEEKATS